MNSSSTPTIAPQELTTPFVPPQALNCTDQYITTSFVSSWYWNDYNETTVTVLASATDAPNFGRCQPAGWEGQQSQVTVTETDTTLTTTTATPFEFSPAVCPSGWTAYAMSRSEVGLTTTLAPTGTWSASTRYSYKTLTTAYCCSSGFTLSQNTYPIDGIGSRSGSACFQDILTGPVTTITPKTTTSSRSSSSSSSSSPFKSASSSSSSAYTRTREPVDFPNGFRVHQPWHISWESADITNAPLSPPPPDLGCTTKGLSVWVPGATVDPSYYEGPCNDGADRWGGGQVAGIWFAIIGIPILVFLIIVGGLSSLCLRMGRRKTVEQVVVVPVPGVQQQQEEIQGRQGASLPSPLVAQGEAGNGGPEPGIHTKG